MEKKLGRIPVVVLTIMAAVVTSILRYVQLQRTVDLTGKIMAGAGKGPLTWVCLGFVVLAAVYCLYLRGLPTIKVREPVSTVLTLLAAFLLALGSAANWSSHAYVAMGGIVSAVCWVVIALQRQQDMTPTAAAFMIPALFYALQIVIEFRDWSRDPLIMDYCFALFAGLFTMCATFHLGGFSLQRGRKRLSVFYCLCGVVFCAVAMMGQSLANTVITGAGALWLLANLWLLLDEG